MVSTEALVGELSIEDDEVSPDLLRMIEERGDEAVEPLLRMIRASMQEPDDVWNVDLAIGILGDLKAKAAVPTLLEYIRRGDSEETETLSEALAAIGEVPLAELLAILRDGSLSASSRMLAADTYIYLGVGSPEAPASWQRVFCELLEELTRRAGELTGDDRDFAGSLVSSLAFEGLAAVKPAMDAAFDAGIIPLIFISRDQAEQWHAEALEAAGDEDDVEEDEDEDDGDRGDEPPFLFEYRRRYEAESDAWDEAYEENLDEERFAEDDDELEPDLYVPSDRDVPEPSERPVHVVKIGRNDICPCGSGKKYKKCCLGKDEGPEA